MAEKIKHIDELKKGMYILFKNKKEESVMKIESISKSFFRDNRGDITCSIGKLEVLVVGSDIENGFVFKTKSKKCYYKKL